MPLYFYIGGRLKITSIFTSIDGEVNKWGQGIWTTFIRFYKCSAHCNYCFGIRPGRKEPKIIYSKTKNRKLNEVEVGDKLLTFNSSKELVETEVIKTHLREVDKYFILKINGTIYFVTPEHPFFTNKGLVTAEDLQIGDEILHATPLQKRSFSKLKENNPNWQGGKQKNWLSLKRKVKNHEIVKCDICSRTDKPIYIHHKDENRFNDNKENLICLCSKCHNKAHKRGLSFWKNNNRKDGKILKNLALNGFKVTYKKFIDRDLFSPSMKPKPLQVFNITCYPYNSYLIDYIWVHNCDTKYSWDGSFTEMNVLDIYDAIPWNIFKITITGGEPLEQKKELLELLKFLTSKIPGIYISIETNGLHDISPIRRTVGVHKDNMCIVMDYKLPSAGEHVTKKIKVSNFLELTDSDYVKFVIQDRNDYEEARKIISNQLAGTEAKLAFSPAKPLKPFSLFKWMKEDYLTWIQFNLQIHKYIFPVNNWRKEEK